MNAAEYIRIFETNPSDDFVTKREAAIRDLSSQYGKIKVITDIAAVTEAMVSVFTTGVVSEDRERERIATAIKKQSSSFIAADRDLEVGVCGLLGLSSTVASTSKTNERIGIVDVYAMTVWSALSFLLPVQEAKMEVLRKELIDLARQRISSSSLDLRQRKDVQAFKQQGDAAIDNAKLAAATQIAIEALRFNAALDREEIDILWWHLGRASTILNQPLSKLSPYLAAVCAGYEVGQLMRTLPSDAHRNLVINFLPDVEPLSLTELIEQIEGDRAVFAAKINTHLLVEAAPLAFPVLTALSSGHTEGPASVVKRPLGEWTARILLESAITRIQFDKSSQI